MPPFTNKATLSYNDTVIDSNTINGELLEVLSATKTAVMDTYVAKDDVTYVISIINTGPLPFTGLTITDNLGRYMFGLIPLFPLTYTPLSVRYYVNGTLQSAPGVVAGPPLVISNITVPAGGNATIIYEVKANQYAPLGVGDSIENTATISGGGLSSDVIATETIYTEDSASLAISKSICPLTVTENGQITYTFIIENFGNTAALAGDNVVLTDTFNPILSALTVDFNGAPWSELTNYTYDPLSGDFATIAGQITVPAATYTQDPIVGNWIVTPGVSVLTVTGTV
ncbi:MAG TPA: hypothetical protein PK629_10685 [Oscillospiraceae bacterium]|nr:hypothetical protein [Oscillospiraceae bacterium]HPF56415.1 hypothetical protein [Clostridiales bacterium]HPK36169.1 hypothetical protein [Oscillospiraceae bacterium]HPR76547.1 hypothetical protein [Oscillospiraceae bacterium]